MTVFRQMGWTALLIAAAVAFGAAAAQAAPLACGATITSNTTLRAHLTNCPGDGLVIGADGVRLNLGRHTIDGSGAPGSAGIRLAGHRRVVVSGGTVKEFETGVALSHADGNRLRGLALHANTGRAIDLSGGSDGNQITGNDAGGNGKTGIALTDSTANVVSGNTAGHNAITGLLLDGASGNRIARNRAQGNVGNGIAIVDGSNRNTVSGNSLSGSQAGIVADSSSRNVIALNRLSANGDSIVVLGNANTVAGNVVRGSIKCDDCGGDGIGVFGGSANSVTANAVHDVMTDGIAVANAAGTIVSCNLVDGAGHDGLKIDSVPTTLSRNVVLHSGNRAVEAVPGVIYRDATPPPRDGHRRPGPPGRMHRR